MNKQLKTSVDKILKESGNSLSAEIRSKLNQSRQLALSQTFGSTLGRLFWLVPLAASIVISVYVLNPLTNKAPTNNPRATEIVSNNFTLAEDMDVSEDLDFYLWLAHEESINI